MRRVPGRVHQEVLHHALELRCVRGHHDLLDVDVDLAPRVLGLADERADEPAHVDGIRAGLDDPVTEPLQVEQIG